MQTSRSLELIPYSGALKKEWDDFTDTAKNGMFLLKRDYMDYHADRFPDCSLIVRRKGRPYALFPATRKGDTVHSHSGLTSGGLIMGRGSTADAVIETMALICARCQEEGASRIIYKPSPHIYHTLPSEEDLYALFRLNATLLARNISSTLSKENRIPFTESRKGGIRKAERSGITTAGSSDFPAFWKILSDNLMSRHGAVPVHTLEEIERLAALFPDNIRLYGAFREGRMTAGAVIYSHPRVAHCQYISSTPDGKKSGALDLLFHTLLNEVYADVPFFDFGTSNLDGGKTLCPSLIFQKEGFGGRGICYDTYEIPLTDETQYS